MVELSPPRLKAHLIALLLSVRVSRLRGIDFFRNLLATYTDSRVVVGHGSTVHSTADGNRADWSGLLS
jgi:hypothetical protein